MSGSSSDDIQARLRAIPSISELLGSADVEPVLREFGEGVAKLELRRLVGEAREGLRRGARHGWVSAASPTEALAAELRERLVRLCRPEGRKAINATGILLHTGLGRAPLCEAALEALAGTGRYTILQTDVETGERSLREEKVERLLVELTGAEAATVVNNNAAATMIALNTLAEGREVVISRGQLVEIGGSFRMPDVMAKSGCVLREVGTTNRTRLADYEAAVGERTGAVMHVHTSNYRIRGFSGWPDVRELAELGGRLGVPVIDDLGSGALVPLEPFGLPDEPMARDSVASGAELVCFSADKLVCGPQGGIVCGRRDAVERIRANPFARMFRTSKLELAALEATLVHFVNGDWGEALPLYRMLSRSTAELRGQAEAVARALSGISHGEGGPSFPVETGDDLAYVGGGCLPDEGVPTSVVRLLPGGGGAPGAPTDAAALAKALRTGVPSVFARVADEAVVLDMRTVDTGEVEALVDAVRRAVGRVSSG